jgi:rubredoxin
MTKYECPCGYIYDPEDGDTENGVEEKTAFKDLPDDWVCPTCQAEKEDFFEAD